MNTQNEGGTTVAVFEDRTERVVTTRQAIELVLDSTGPRVVVVSSKTRAPILRSTGFDLDQARALAGWGRR